MHSARYTHLYLLMVIVATCSTTFSMANHVQKAPRALVCLCNQCETDSCTTSAHVDSVCFKSVQRQVENETYVWVESFGCISGSDDRLDHLQCHVGNLNHLEPQMINCCNDNNFCNQDLPDPGDGDDPRWFVSAPPPVVHPEAPAKHAVGLVVGLTVLLTCLCALLFIVIYRISEIFYQRYVEKKKQLSSRNSTQTIEIDYDELLKTQFANQHNIVGSIPDSDRTYTISDHIPTSNSPYLNYDNSLPISENSDTHMDLTSGVGACVLQQRTIARVVDMGDKMPVGFGRFGRVFKGVHNHKDVAVKAFQPIDLESWQREVKIFEKLNHANIVRYLASETYTIDSTHATETWMFLEFCPYGSLCDFMDKNEIIGPQQAIKIIFSIISGLNYLHEDYSTGGGKSPIAHRDIKSKNILMRTPEECCLADFGHAVIKVNEDTLDFGGYGSHRLQVGTVRYLAPEILKPTRTLDITQFHTFAQADLYQFSLVLWEICSRTALDVLHPAQPHRLPYDGVVPQNPNVEDMIKIVCDDNYRPARSLHWDRSPEMSELSLLMEECWRANPKARMETLGVWKRIKQLHDQLPQPAMYYQSNLISNSISPPHYYSSDRHKNTDITL